MSKTVLLARPHNIIAPFMKDFMIRNGFEPHVISDLKDLYKFKQKKIYGIVISTAVNSMVKESFIEVFLDIRKKFTNVPIIFATFGDLKVMSKLISQMILKVEPNANLVSLDEKNTSSIVYSENTFLLLNKDSLINNKLDLVLKSFFIQ